MIDTHTHILPSIDDGSKNISYTMSMIKEAKEVGFTDIITTSHYIENEYNVSKEDRKKIIKEIQEIIKKEKIDINLYNGAEIYITNKVIDLVNDNIVPTLAESRYVLLELPLSTSNVLYFDQVIEYLITAKYKPIIAHPERYDTVKENPNIAVDWVKKGVLLQANYGSIIGRYGHKAKQAILKLLDANAIHFLGSDIHMPTTIYTQMDEIIKEYKNKIGEEKLEELSETNPRKILNNEIVDKEEPKEIVVKKHWFSR